MGMRIFAAAARQPVPGRRPAPRRQLSPRRARPAAAAAAPHLTPGGNPSLFRDLHLPPANLPTSTSNAAPHPGARQLERIRRKARHSTLAGSLPPPSHPIGNTLLFCFPTPSLTFISFRSGPSYRGAATGRRIPAAVRESRFGVARSSQARLPRAKPGSGANLVAGTCQISFPDYCLNRSGIVVNSDTNTG